MGRLTLVLGGQKSGKSALAARRATDSGRRVVVVTPAVVRDAEFAARVARHRTDRPAGWQTLETFDLTDALAQAGSGAFVIVDALDTWLAETLEVSGVSLGDDLPDASQQESASTQVLERLREFATAVAAADAEVVVIAGQPGLGVHAGGAGARAYVDLHGRAVREISDAADEALLVVGGRVVALAHDSRPAGPSGPTNPTGHADSAVRAGDPAAAPTALDPLRDHGDRQVPADTVDLAVNVEPGPPPWLAERLTAALGDLARYPDDGPARDAVAARHGRSPDSCLPVNGAAEAFRLLAHALQPRLAACVHPSFTEPEAALRAAGVPVTRFARSPEHDWALDPASVPADADLVVIGRPDNPTGAFDPVSILERLIRPGRMVVVDEAFVEFCPEAGGLADRGDLPGLVSVRSLTKLWGLAGLRVGYLVGPASLVARMDALRQPWTCNSLALVALAELTRAEDDRRERAAAVASRRDHLVAELAALPQLRVWASPANFVLIGGPVPALRERLLEHGLATRRADTFPGLDDRHIRVAVRDRATNDALVQALRAICTTAEEQ